MLAAGSSLASADRVHALIMCTRHNVQPNGIDAEIVTDVDLGILGASPEKFALYERQIREEYNWVPTFLFRRKRTTILKYFLQRPHIYSAELYHQQFETQARLNLLHALAELSGPILSIWRNRFLCSKSAHMSKKKSIDRLASNPKKSQNENPSSSRLKNVSGEIWAAQLPRT